MFNKSMQKVKAILLSLTISLSIISAGAAANPITVHAATPAACNPNATQKTKDTFNYLFNLRNSAVNYQLSGHFLGFSDEITTFYSSDVFKATGKFPAVVHVDYEDGWRDISYAPFNSVKPNAVAIDAWNHGSLIQLGWHAHNPLNGNSFMNGSMPAADFEKLVQPGTTQYTIWHQKLDQVAAGFQQLQNAGVVVMFRPLHEMDSNWNWWDGQSTQDYINVYRDMYNYFTNVKGLNNLLWIYCPCQYTDSYYPGDDVVDIVGEDPYSWDNYDIMNSLHGANKIIANPEKNGDVNVMAHKNLAFWSDWDDNLLGNDQDTSSIYGMISLKSKNPYTFMNDQRIADRSLVPGNITGNTSLGNSYADNFESTALGAYPSNWLDGKIGGIGDWKVSQDGSNKVYRPASITANAVASLDVCLDDVTLQGDIKPYSHNSNSGLWLAVRWNCNDMNILGGYNYSTGRWEIRENMSPVNSLVRAYSGIENISDGTNYTVKIVASGNKIDLYVNNVLKASTSTSQKYWPGEIAVVADNIDAGFDNISVSGTFNQSTDIALCRPVTASSAINTARFNPKELTDNVIYGMTNELLSAASPKGFKSGSSNTSANSNEWVEVDLGSNQNFSQVNLYPRNDMMNVSGTGSANFPVNYKIQVKPDGGSAYTDIVTVSNQPNPNGNVQSYSFTTQSARYVRINATTLGDPAADEPGIYRLSLAEMQVFGTGTKAGSKVDDYDAGITYCGNWNFSTNVNGYYDNTAHWTTNTGDYVQYTFFGTNINWIGKKGTDHGKVDVYIDGIYDSTLSTYAPANTLQTVLYGKAGLTNGTHTIKIVQRGDKDANSSDYFNDIDAFYQSPISNIDDYDSSITYSGNWNLSTNVNGYYDNTAHWTSNAGDYAQYAFSGTSINWIGKKGTDHGKVDVYIDGIFVSTVSTYAPTNTLQTVLYSKAGMNSGVHTIKIVQRSDKDANASDYFNDIDAFQYGN